MVVLKRIDTSVHPHELEITQYFSTEPIASHPRNHCVPLYEAFMVPDQPNYVILVTPLLTESNYPKMLTIGEAVEFFRQIFEARCHIHFSIVCADLNSTGPSIHSSVSCSAPVRRSFS